MGTACPYALFPVAGTVSSSPLLRHRLQAAERLAHAWQAPSPHQTTRANGRCRQSEKTRLVDSARQLTPLAVISQKIRRKREAGKPGDYDAILPTACARRGGIFLTARRENFLCVVPPDRRRQAGRGKALTDRPEWVTCEA